MNNSFKQDAAGFSLIEVLIAVVILSFGLLALAALQSGLFRAGAEAKARANATQIAQQALEDARTFAYTQSPGGSYAGNTFVGIGTATLPTNTVAGVSYKGCIGVRRFVYDNASSRFVAKNSVNFSASMSGGVLSVTCSETAIGGVVAFDPSTPEFKEVSVSVAWPGETGQVKTVQLTDSVAAIAPADSVQVLKTPTGTAMGPQVYIVPPNKGNPGVVPIAIGTSADGEDIAAASSNPKPEQFVQDVSSVTTFNVQTFTGDPAGDEVLLNRQLAVSAAGCVCSDSGTAVSTATSPAYAPTVWNGKQQAYMEPDAIVGKRVASAVISNSDSVTTALCTACCRDHHDNTAQPVKFDPYRGDARLVDGDHQHYGYTKSGNQYDIGAGLKLLGSATGNEYEEACRLIRVNGRMRVAVDGQQNYQTVVPLNASDPPTGFLNTNFVTDYSNFVSAYIKEALANVPTGYPSATAKLPPPSSTILADAAYDTEVVAPGTISLATSGEKRKLVDFGLYIDYLNQDTLDAYTCALNNDTTGDCEAFGSRNPLEFIPFYAVNVANLGAWNSAKTDVATVSNVHFSNQGVQDTDGGNVLAGTGNSNTAFNVTNTIKRSNSGLTNTAAVDPEDGDVANLDSDVQLFAKQGGGQNPDYHFIYLVPRTIDSGINNLGNLLSVLPLSCSKKPGPQWACQYDANSGTPVSIVLSGFTTSKTQGGNTVITDRQICLPTSTTPLLTSTPTGDGTAYEDMTIGLSSLGASNWTVQFDVILDLSACAGGLTVTAQ